MKLIRVRFTTRYDLTPFGEVSDILTTSQELDLHLTFHSGGWNRGETTVCYHEWKTESNPEIVKNFLKLQYGKSLIDIHLDDEISSIDSSNFNGGKSNRNG